MLTVGKSRNQTRLKVHLVKPARADITQARRPAIVAGLTLCLRTGDTMQSDSCPNNSRPPDTARPFVVELYRSSELANAGCFDAAFRVLESCLVLAEDEADNVEFQRAWLYVLQQKAEADELSLQLQHASPSSFDPDDPFDPFGLEVCSGRKA